MEVQTIIQIFMGVALPACGWFIVRLQTKVDDLSERMVRTESRLDSINEATKAINQVREDLSYLKATMEQFMIRMDSRSH